MRIPNWLTMRLAFCMLIVGANSHAQTIVRSFDAIGGALVKPNLRDVIGKKPLGVGATAEQMCQVVTLPKAPVQNDRSRALDTGDPSAST